MFLEILPSIAYKNNTLEWCTNTFSDRVVTNGPVFLLSDLWISAIIAGISSLKSLQISQHLLNNLIVQILVSLITHNQDLFFNIDIVIRRKDMVRVKKKIKALEFQLRKMLELHERSQTTKENSKSKSSIGNVIRRRKGEPDKWISCKLNGSWIAISLFRTVRHIHTFNFHQ